MMYLDLHIHSTASDGELSPLEILDIASTKNFSMVSITDHDSVNGYDSLDAASFSGVLLPGVELSANLGEERMHILGYGIDPFDSTLRDTLEQIRRFRFERQEKLIAAMHREGFEISEEDILLESEGGVPGRPHIAAAMVRKGMIKTVKDAFDLYLDNPDSSLYIEKRRIEAKEVIALIQNAGGVAVCAHPLSEKKGKKCLRTMASELKEMGIEGLEAFYFRYTPEQTRDCLETAKELGLFVTAGSDFHGSRAPDVPSPGMRVPGEAMEPFFSLLENRFGSAPL